MARPIDRSTPSCAPYRRRVGLRALPAFSFWGFQSVSFHLDETIFIEPESVNMSAC